MKYIRTKDGIYSYEPTHNIDVDGFIVQHINGWNEPLTRKDIIKIADTIDELCDCFVCEGFVYKDFIKCVLARMIADSKSTLYGSIWITLPNGAPRLEPVAKMNDKGELELL